jgi:hypothetical protein
MRFCIRMGNTLVFALPFPIPSSFESTTPPSPSTAPPSPSTSPQRTLDPGPPAAGVSPGELMRAAAALLAKPAVVESKRDLREEVRPPERRATAASRDLFSTSRVADTSRTHLAFSTGRARPSQPGASPPLGSVFATRRDTPVPAAAPGEPVARGASAAERAFERGHERVGQGDYHGALDAWREAVSLMPGNRTYQANLRRLELILAPEADGV